MNSKGMSQVAFGILLAGALAFPVQAAPITYGFDDGTLQGWTTVSSDPGNSPDPESYVSANWHTVQGGTKAVYCNNFGNRDNAHKPLWIRSPEFVINQSGDLTLWLYGGTSKGGYPGTSGTFPTNASQIPLGVDSTVNGLMGVALRDTSTGAFVLTAERPGPSDGSWKQIVLNVSAYLNDGKRYTVELFDYHSGNAFSQLAMDTVSIPGTLVPVITGAATATAFQTASGTPSAAQSFAVSGLYLTADITATAPTGFEVSSDGSTYATTATFTQSGGSASGTLRIRLAATAAVGTTIYDSQNIVLSTSGATSVNITTASTGNAVVPEGSPLITATGTLSSMMTATGIVSAATSFSISGANMTAGITVTPPAGLEVSTTSDFSSNVGNSGAPITIGTSGTIAATNVYVRLAATAAVGNYNSLNIVLSSSGAVPLNVSTTSSGNRVTSPSITKTGTLATMSTKSGTASTATSFSVSGTDMAAGITVTPPSGLEVSTTSSTSGFAGSGTAITVGTSGTIAATTVYVRLAATAAVGTYNSLNIVLSSTGVTSVNVPTTASGNIVGNPVITATGTLATMSSVYGTASVATSFTVSGTDMNAGITVTPPVGLEVSTTSATSGFAGNSTAITVGAAGTIAATTVYVRLAATAGVGSYDSKNIVLTSTYATTRNVATTASGNTVSGVTLTYGFDDSTLQGWTTVSSDPGNTPDPESYVSANYDTAQAGTKAVYCNNFGNRDNAHKPLWIRSPEFVINQSGYLTLWLLGGAGKGDWPGTTGTLPTNASQIPLGVDSTVNGVMGVALRDVATGAFVLTGQRITSAGGVNWIQIAWDVSAYRNNGKHYTLELFDYHSGNGYSQLAMDSVSIPGTLVSDLPKGTMIRFY